MIEEIKRKIERYRKYNEGDKVIDYYNETHLPEFVMSIEYLLEHNKALVEALENVIKILDDQGDWGYMSEEEYQIMLKCKLTLTTYKGEKT